MSDRTVDVDDAAGLHTLEMFSATGSFNRWMFDAIEPYCKGSILEIGSGIGNLSALLLETCGEVSLSDQKESYCNTLDRKFKTLPSLKGVYRLDLADKNLAMNHPELSGKFDTIIALNVVEHIDDEQRVLENIKELLKNNGRIVMLVPAFNFLYNGLDKELGHYRRYTRKHIGTLFQQPQWKIDTIRFFNSPGIFGWWLYGNVWKKRLITQRSLFVYNKLVPLFRLSDGLFRNVFGLSLIAVATVNKT